MAETPKKAKAPSTSRKAAAPESSQGEAATHRPATAKTATKKATPKKSAMAELITMLAPAPTHDQIAELARKYWAERGFVDGHHEDDWFRAEQELRAKAS